MKYEEAKKLNVMDLLEILQDMVKVSVAEMKSNTELISQIQKKESSSKEKTKKLRYLIRRNSEITNQNNQYLKLHTRLLSFLKSLTRQPEEGNRKTPAYKPENAGRFAINSFDECFEMTIHSIIPYNHKHPYFTNESFRKKLINYYILEEEYEKCTAIINSKIIENK